MINYFGEEVALKRTKLKKDIKIESGKCAKILLALGILVQVIALVIILILKLTGNSGGTNIEVNAQNGSIIGMSNELYDFLTQYLPCILGDIIAIILGVKITKVKIKSQMFCRNESKRKFIILGALSCIGVGIISNIIYTIYAYLLENAGITIPAPDFNFPKGNLFMLALFLGYVCVLGPIMEEIIFRGIILKSLQKYGNLTAIIITSILFSMFHLNLVQFVPPVLIGLVLGIITVKSKSIIPSIIAHMFNNTVSVVISLVDPTQIVLLNMVTVVYVLVSILGLWFFIREYGREIIKIIKEDTKVLKTHQKIRASFTGGWSITYVLFYLIIIGIEFFATNIH